MQNREDIEGRPFVGPAGRLLDRGLGDLGWDRGRLYLTNAVTRMRGQWERRSDGIAVLITLHPSALLRAPPEEFEESYRAWLADLRQASEFAAHAAMQAASASTDDREPDK